MENTNNPTLYPADLGGGLLLRRSTAADGEALAVFNSRMHSDDGPDKPDEGLAHAVRDLMSGHHPSFRPDDFTLVEDTSTGRIVSCMCLISQTWSYAGIPFKVGRPELVATELGFRDRGLVRRQFEVIHQWSHERGEQVQAITGIPIYYRKFGYEMALDLEGSRTLYESLIPKLKEGETEPYRLRPASEGDIDFLDDLYKRNTGGSLLQCFHSRENWIYDLNRRNPDSVDCYWIYVLESQAGQPVGMIATFPMQKSTTLYCKRVDLLPTCDRYSAARSIARQLWQVGKEGAEKIGKTLSVIQFDLSREHPFYELLGEALQRPREPYAWYMRVPDVPGFLRLIRPVLEARLADSVCSGYSGSMKLMLEHSGVEIRIEGGLITSIEANNALLWGDCDAVYPGLTFLQRLFGYRSQDDLEHSFADCFVTTASKPVNNALFPVQASSVWMIS